MNVITNTRCQAVLLQTIVLIIVLISVDTQEHSQCLCTLLDKRSTAARVMSDKGLTQHLDLA